MKKVFKWVGIILAGLVSLLLLVMGTAYIYTNITIVNKVYTPDYSGYKINANDQDIAEGLRLAKIRGCSGCHGPEFAGNVPFEAPFMFKAVAPNLPSVMNNRTDDELDKSIRQGIAPDGTSTLAMPSTMYYHLSDEDLSKIITAIRQIPITAGFEEGGTSFGAPIRAMMMFGIMDYRGQRPEVMKLGERVAADTSDVLGYGEYLARTSCTECHGLNFEGQQLTEAFAPDLRMVKSYPLDGFTNLMKTGVTLAGTQNKMSDVAMERFAVLKENEIESLHKYLSGL